MKARELAASKAMYSHNTTEMDELPVDEFDCCAVEALKAADELDEANGVFRVAVCASEVEGMAMVLSQIDAGYFPFRTGWNDVAKTEEDKDRWREKARAILWYLRKEAL